MSSTCGGSPCVTLVRITQASRTSVLQGGRADCSMAGSVVLRQPFALSDGDLTWGRRSVCPRGCFGRLGGSLSRLGPCDVLERSVPGGSKDRGVALIVRE